LKIAPAGSLIWHQAFSVANGSSALLLEHLELDATQHIYLAGRAGGTVDVDPGSNTQMMMTYPYPQVTPVVIRLDATGNFASYDSLDVFSHVFKINRDTLFFAGGFTGTPDLDPSGITYTVASQGASDCYLLALNKTYDLQWALTFGGTTSDQIYNLAFSNSHEVYVSGFFSGAVDFDPAFPTNTLAAQATNDGFFSKFSPCPDMPFNGSYNTICAGQTASLISLNSSAVTWYQNSTGGNPIGTGSAYITPTLSAGIFTFYAVSASCSLMPRTPFVALVNALPTITVSGSTKTICPGQTVTLTASGAQSFSWTGGPVNATYSVSPLQTSSYTVVGEDSTTLCKNTQNITVTVSICSDLKEFANSNIRIFPNPSDGVFVVQTQQDGIVVIADALGRVLYRIEGFEGTNQIDISSFPSGMYFLSTNCNKSKPTSIIVFR
jgi:hypothetical protein